MPTQLARPGHRLYGCEPLFTDSVPVSIVISERIPVRAVERMNRPSQ